MAMDVPRMAPLIISFVECISASYLDSATIRARPTRTNLTRGSLTNKTPMVDRQNATDVWPETKPPLKAVPCPS